LNRVTADPSDAWIGVVATGYTYYQVLDALRRMGLDGLDAIARVGIRLLHLRLPVPFDTALVADFARGLQEIVVVEEKNPTLERLIRDALYDATVRPRVVGKLAADGSRLLPAHGHLDADVIAPALRQRLEPRLTDRLAPPPPPARALLPLATNRTPFFCSGCPHNWGVKVPDGSIVGAGTGCHGMTLLMDEERVGESIGITHTEKNITDAIFGTLFNIPEKTKDNTKARLDVMKRCDRPKQNLRQPEGRKNWRRQGPGLFLQGNKRRRYSCGSKLCCSLMDM
jgi:indolepyruvate ferredoxin oxidoreductase